MSTRSLRNKKRQTKMQLDKLYCEGAYVQNGRFNHIFMGSELEVLKLTKHKYDRHDLAEAYRFIADIIEFGDFEWPGTFPLKKPENSVKITNKKNKGK